VRAIAQRSLREVAREPGPGPIPPELVQRLLAARDRRPVTIAE